MSPESRNIKRDVKMYKNMNPGFPFLAKFHNWFKRNNINIEGTYSEG